MLFADVPVALTFDDVLLVPRHSTFLPRDVDTSVRLTKHLHLKVPLLSAAMDTVTESAAAIAMAHAGGLGIVHKNLSVQRQADEVRRVKKAVTGIISDPVTVGPDATIGSTQRLMREHGISGVPVTVDGRAVGILTNRDLRFERARRARPRGHAHQAGHRRPSAPSSTRPRTSCRSTRSRSSWWSTSTACCAA
jgi:IMP dehydrogenase